MKQLTEKISYLSNRCWKISNQKEVKIWIVASFNMPKKMFQIVSIPGAKPKRITKEIDNRTQQYYKSLEKVKVIIKKLKLPVY